MEAEVPSAIVLVVEQELGCCVTMGQTSSVTSRPPLPTFLSCIKDRKTK